MEYKATVLIEGVSPYAGYFYHTKEALISFKERFDRGEMNEDLRFAFRKVGTVKDISLKYDSGGQGLPRGNNRGNKRG